MIEIAKEYNYLDILLSRSGSFCKAKKKKHLCGQAQKAMYIYSIIRKYDNLPVDCQLDLIDKVITPVLLWM